MNPESRIRDSGFRIEPAAEEDADSIAELAAVIWRAHYADIISAAQIEYMLKQRYESAQIRAELVRGVAWEKAVVDGAIVGYASYFRAGDGAEMKLDKLYVHDDFQRRGIGGQMLARAIAAARKAGCGTLILAVNKANAKAIAAYRKYGFRIRGSVVQEIGAGFVMDDYFMVKDV